MTEEKASTFSQSPQLINPSAVLPDLPSGARQRCNVTHLDHASHKICKKRALATNI